MIGMTILYSVNCLGCLSSVMCCCTLKICEHSLIQIVIAVCVPVRLIDPYCSVICHAVSVNAKVFIYCIYTGWAKKLDCYLKVCKSCI